MSLQKCITDLNEALAGYDISGISARVGELQKEGLTKREAEVQAVQERVNELRENIRSGAEGSLPESEGAEYLSDALSDDAINSIVLGTPLEGVSERPGVAGLADFYDRRVHDQFGRRLDQRSEADKRLISRQIANEVRWAIARSNSGASWYSSTIENALAYAAELHPEIATDPQAATAFRAIMAITSNGMDVQSNATYTEQLYNEYKKTGKFPIKGFGTTAGAMKTSFKLLNDMVEKNGWESTIEFLNTPYTVRELKQMGAKISGELMDTQVYGSMIFGPKIGAFYQNLSGNFDPITMDRWFMRTWGRYTGTSTPTDKQVQEGLANFREVIRASGRMPKGYSKRKLMRDDDAVMELASKLYSEFSKGGFKDKSPLNNAARNLFNRVAPVITPRNGNEREWIRQVFRHAQDQLASEGLVVDSASLQATLWYMEKDLFAANGIKGKRQEATDYEREFRKLVEEKAGRERADSVGAAIQRSQRRHAPHTTRAAAETDTTVLNQGFPYTYELEAEPLRGAKPTRKVPGHGDVEFRPFRAAREAAREYMRRAGLEYIEIEDYAKLDINRATRIAREYERVEHNPNDPLVKAAYEALAKEAIAQFEVLLETGIDITFEGPDPYTSPSEVIMDVVENNHMWVFKTDEGYGDKTGKGKGTDVTDNPMLQPTDFVIGGHRLLVNDVFRVVHDYFGHIKNGVGFRAEGEENAWQAHAAMFSPLARRALTTETRGQNSWLNYGPYGETNRTAKLEETVFADQKIGLMPLWVSEEGHVNAKQIGDTDGRDANGTLIRPPITGGRITLSHHSKKKGLERLDPEFYGANIAGVERERAMSPDWVNRTYYGIAPRTPGGYVVEPGVGNVEYTTSVDAGQLYDLVEDPDGLKGQGITKYEKAIRDKGYSGYWIKHPKLGMVAAVFDAMEPETQNGEPMILFQEDLDAQAQMQEWMDSIQEEEIQFDADLEELLKEPWEDEEYMQELVDARDNMERNIVGYAKKEYGYEGQQGTEAIEWIEGMKKFGPEGMTFEARMERARKMGFDVDTTYYHGSPQWTAGPEGITAFYLNTDQQRPFVFVSPDSDFANSFAGLVGSNFNDLPAKVKSSARSKSIRPAVYPVFIKDQNILKTSTIYAFDKFMDAYGAEALTSDSPKIKQAREEYFRVANALQETLIQSDIDNFTDYTQQMTDYWDVPDGEGDVMEQVYHTGVRWRMTALATGDWQSIETDGPIQEMIEELGFDGFTVLEGGDPTRGFKDPDNVENIALYNPADIRSVNAVFDPDKRASANLLSQRRKDGPRGFIELHPNNERVIRLTEASDLSTFMHESAHLILEAEKQFAAKYGTSENQRAILKMLNVETFDQITRTEHEQFARTFEDYIRTGKAPSRKLQAAFAAFARWLGNIYRSVKQIGLKLDEESVAVFDRLLATEAEIEEAATDPIYDEMFTSAAAAGMTQEQWKKHQEAQARRKDAAQATLFEKLVNELTRRRTKEWKEERAPIIEERTKALEKSRTYQAKANLRSNRLAIADVKEALGVEQIPDKYKNLVKKTGGQDPDIVAEQYNYGSVEEMLNDIADAPTIKEKATTEAEEIMKGKYGDILNDGTIEEEARVALHNEEQGQFLLREIRALGRQARKPAIDGQELKARAKAMVDGMNYEQLNPRKYYRAEVRAAEKAGAAKSPEEAYEYKVQQLANHHLFMESMKAQKDMERYSKYVKGVQARKYRGSQVDPEYISEMKTLAKIYDMRKRPNSKKRVAAAKAFNNWIKGQQAAGVDVNLKDLAMIKLLHGDTNLLPTFDQLTVEELRSVYDQLRHLRYVGGRIAKQQKAEFEQERAALVEAADKNGRRGNRDKWESDKQKTIGFGARHLVNLLPSLRNLIRRMDNDPGSKGGSFFDSIYRRIADAETRKQKLLHDTYQKFDDLFKDTNILDLNDSRRSVKTVVKEKDGSKWQLSARQRYMLAVYWGTESSREAVRQGFNVTDTDVMNMMGHLTQEQLRAVQKMWDLSEHMKPDLFAAAVEREGVAPEELPPAPFTVNGVQLRGGHMRLFYGNSEADLVQKIRLDEDPLSAVNFIVPGKAGSAIERVGSGGKPVLLDTNNIFRAIEDNVHFIAYSKAASELQSIYNNPDVRNAIARNFGDGYDKALMQNIQGLTTNYKEREVNSFVSTVIRRLRTAKSMMYLAYNLRNTIQQVASVIPTAAEQGPLNYLNSMGHAYSNWAEAKRFVESKSPQMLARRDALTREHSEMLKRVVVGTKWEQFNTKAKQYGFAPQVAIDTLISYPAWIKKYHEGMEAHGDEGKAIIDADVLVAETIGSGLDLHLGKVLRSNENEFVRMMVLFGSFFNSSVFQRAWKSVYAGKGIQGKAAFEALMLTPLMMAVMSQLMVGDIPKGEEEDDPWWKWVATTYRDFMSATVPVFGELASAVVPGGSRFKPSTVLDDALYGVTEVPGRVESYMEGDSNGFDLSSDMLKIIGSFIFLPGSGNFVRYLDAAGEEEGLPPISDTYRAIVEGSDKNPR